MKQIICITLGAIALITAGLFTLGKIRQRNEEAVDLTPNNSPGDKDDSPQETTGKPPTEPEPAPM